jgi:hypothetical protein
MTRFAEVFLDARRRIENGEDPELVVPELLEVAEAGEEIEMARRLYGDDGLDDPADPAA